MVGMESTATQGREAAGAETIRSGWEEEGPETS